MKTCPTCKQQYNDPSLNFCLDDGTPLEGSVVPGDQTLVMEPRPTNLASGQTPMAQPAWAVGQAQGQFQPQTPPKARSSRTLIWVAGILAVVVMICGGGFAGILYLGNRASTSDNPRNSRPTAAPTPAKTATTTTDTRPDLTKAQFESIKVGADRKDVEKIMGSAGDEYYSGTGGGVSFTSVKWVGQNYKTILVSFRNNKVTSKSQVGLDK